MRPSQADDRTREEVDIEIYDAVEIDYDPRDEAEISGFLEEAEFDYSVGSVHEVAGTNVQVSSTVGTDSHAPGEIGARTDFLEAFLADWRLEPVDPPALE